MYLINHKTKSYHQTNELDIMELLGVDKGELESLYYGGGGRIRTDLVNKDLGDTLKVCNNLEVAKKCYPQYTDITQFL